MTLVRLLSARIPVATSACSSPTCKDSNRRPAPSVSPTATTTRSPYAPDLEDVFLALTGQPDKEMGTVR
jgi:hypothetical protein